MIRFAILCFCVLILGCGAGKAPFVNPCKANDDACLLTSSRAALPFFAAGIPELGVPSADPIYLENVNGDTGELKLTFIHMQVVGASQCEITKFVFQDADSYHLELECPITATGQYTVGGKLAIVPIEGDGDFEIKTDKIKIIVDFVLAEVAGHWKIASYTPNFEPIEKFYIKLGNLFNGDQKKAEPVLGILDHGWRDLVIEIGKPIIFEIIAKVLDGVAKFYDAVPVSELRLQ